jgi:hypothetical protein
VLLHTERPPGKHFPNLSRFKSSYAIIGLGPRRSG